MGRTTAEVLAALDGGRTGLRCPDLPVGLHHPGRRGARRAAQPAEWVRPLRHPPGPHRDDGADPDRARGARGHRPLGQAPGRHPHRHQHGWARRHRGRLPITSHYTGACPRASTLHTQHDFNALGELYAAVLGVEGPVYVISSACSSSGKVHASAARLIARGHRRRGARRRHRQPLPHDAPRLSGPGHPQSKRRARPFSCRAQRHQHRRGCALMLLEREHGEAERRGRARRGRGVRRLQHELPRAERTRRARGDGARDRGRQASREARRGSGARPRHGHAAERHWRRAPPSRRALLGTSQGGLDQGLHRPPARRGRRHRRGLRGARHGAHRTHPREPGRRADRPAIGVVAKPCVRPQLGRHEPSLGSPSGACVELLANAFAFGGSNVCLAIGRAPSETR
jgi:3-oxoacyl-[acyl-carrier-protein] synthase-1